MIFIFYSSDSILQVDDYKFIILIGILSFIFYFIPDFIDKILSLLSPENEFGDVMPHVRHTYYFKTKIFSWHNYLIEDENKKVIFYEDFGVFRDAARNNLYKIKKPFLEDRYKIKRPDGSLLATIENQKGFFSSNKWKIEILDGPKIVSYFGSGQISVISDRIRIAAISRKGFIQKFYKVEITSEQYDTLILAIITVLIQVYEKEEAREKEKENREKEKEDREWLREYKRKEKEKKDREWEEYRKRNGL